MDLIFSYHAQMVIRLNHIQAKKITAYNLLLLLLLLLYNAMYELHNVICSNTD